MLSHYLICWIMDPVLNQLFDYSLSCLIWNRKNPSWKLWNNKEHEKQLFHSIYCRNEGNLRNKWFTCLSALSSSSMSRTRRLSRGLKPKSFNRVNGNRSRTRLNLKPPKHELQHRCHCITLTCLGGFLGWISAWLNRGSWLLVHLEAPLHEVCNNTVRAHPGPRPPLQLLNKALQDWTVGWRSSRLVKSRSKWTSFCFSMNSID